MNEFTDESGTDFELRGLNLARALHDPTGTQGAIMHLGKERDGLFIGSETINAYEFTTEQKKAKAEKDGKKLAELLSSLQNRDENKYKAATGWFVTRDEPTAEQRSAIDKISRDSGRKIHAIGVATLYSRICDSRAYLQRRDNAPFGSIDRSDLGYDSSVNVEVSLTSAAGDLVDMKSLSAQLSVGGRALIVGEFGVGKSHTLREIYKFLKKRHYKGGNREPFPVHINLRDCAGLRTSTEILRRHSDEVGFNNSAGLISAWRAGACILLLDGFDEIVPTRWLGGVSDLKTVRYEALASVRRLVSETPQGSGIVLAGRAHYFSSHDELVETLGFRALDKYEIREFDEAQLDSFLLQSGVEWGIPDWAPRKPLFLGYLVSLGGESVSGIFQTPGRAAGWRKFLDELCMRESYMFTAVRPVVIKSLVSRVATLARSRSDVTGPVGMDLLKEAFTAVTGRQPDEEGIQLLQRLPGLALTPYSAENEERVFVDRDLAETGYGEELAVYIYGPHAVDSPLNSEATWSNACDGLAVEVAASVLEESSTGSGSVISAINYRQSVGSYDAITADLIRVAQLIANDDESIRGSVVVSGVFFERLEVEDSRIGSAVNYQDCVIEVLDLNGIDQESDVPSFHRCSIGFVDGAASLPGWLSGRFLNCDIAEFSSATKTNAGIMALSIDKESKIALTVLKKVYMQRGNGRKETALVRGIDPVDRHLVAGVVSTLVGRGWLSKSSAGRNTVYTPSPLARADVMSALDNPFSFRV